MCSLLSVSRVRQRSRRIQACGIAITVGLEDWQTENVSRRVPLSLRMPGQTFSHILVHLHTSLVCPYEKYVLLHFDCAEAGCPSIRAKAVSSADVSWANSFRFFCIP